MLLKMKDGGRVNLYPDKKNYAVVYAYEDGSYYLVRGIFTLKENAERAFEQVMNWFENTSEGQKLKDGHGGLCWKAKPQLIEIEVQAKVIKE